MAERLGRYFNKAAAVVGREAGKPRRSGHVYPRAPYWATSVHTGQHRSGFCFTIREDSDTERGARFSEHCPSHWDKSRRVVPNRFPTEGASVRT